MPPFCAPSPSHLLSESSPVARSPSPEENEDDDRAEMVASLVTALADAEAAAAAQGNNAQNPEQQHQLASQAYTSLCFDFPIVSTNALAALAYVFRSSSLGTGAPIFPITAKFTSGLRYLVSIEFTKQGSLDGVVATEDVDTEREGESFGQSIIRCNRLSELCGCVFLLAPASRLAAAHTDDGASLQAFLAAYDSSAADLLEQHNDLEDATTSAIDLENHFSNAVEASELESEAQSTAYDEMAAEMDDDDSDWEALEVFTSQSRVTSVDEPTTARHGEIAAWPELMDKVALLTRTIPSEVINNGVWGELKLTEHLIRALSGMRILERMEPEAVVIPIAKLYADLLSDHLISSWSTSASEVIQFLSALMALVEIKGDIVRRSSLMAGDQKSVSSWNFLVLSTLANLCAKVGGYPAKRISPNSNVAGPFDHSASNGIRKHGPLPSSSFFRNLWQSVFSSLQFLEAQLTQAQGGAGSSSHLEMVLWVLCFMVKYAPGNMDLRETLLEGGIFRIVLQLFVKAGGEPEMEPLRHFLLVSMASSTALAEYAAQVSSFKAAMSATSHCAEGSYAKAHATIWPLILRAACRPSPISKKTAAGYSNPFESRDVEGNVVAAFDGIVEAVTDDTMKTNTISFLNKLVWLNVLLSILGDAISASPRSTFNLWQRRSPLDISIGQCQAALGSLQVQVTDKALISSPRPIVHQKKSEDTEDSTEASENIVENDSITSTSNEFESSVIQSAVHEAKLVAAQEKLKELLPSLLLQLKLLSALTKENREAKID